MLANWNYIIMWSPMVRWPRLQIHSDFPLGISTYYSINELSSIHLASLSPLCRNSVSVRKSKGLLCMHVVSCLGLLVWKTVTCFWSGTGAFKWCQKCQIKGGQGQVPRPSVPCLTHLLVSKLWLIELVLIGQTPGAGWQQSSVDKKHTAFIYLLASFYLGMYPHLPKVSTHWFWCNEKSSKALNFVVLQKRGKGWLMYRSVAAIVNKGTFSKWLTKISI